jgi:hypothetical protein
MKQGIEDWNEAFAAAGFRNAIVAKDPPTAAEDPDWDAEDVRIRRSAGCHPRSRTPTGPSIVDPRSARSWKPTSSSSTTS